MTYIQTFLSLHFAPISAFSVLVNNALHCPTISLFSTSWLTDDLSQTTYDLIRSLNVHLFIILFPSYIFLILSFALCSLFLPYVTSSCLSLI
jgi:hypothetical protein